MRFKSYKNTFLPSLSPLRYEIEKHSSSVVMGKCNTVNISSNFNDTVFINYSHILKDKTMFFTQSAKVIKSNLWSFKFDQSLSGEIC